MWHHLSGLLLIVLLAACAPALEQERPQPEDLEFEPLTFHPPEVETLELDNGIRLYLNEDHELPLVQVTAMVGGGAIGEPAARTGMTDLFAATLRTGGTQRYAPDELDRELERLAADLSVSAGTYATTLGLSLQAKDLKRGLAILDELLRRPAFAPERLELARRQMIEGIRRQNDRPGKIAGRLFRQALYGDHPLGRTPTEETVSAVTRRELRAFHERFFHPNNLWLAISGDFDREQLLARLQSLYGQWQEAEILEQKIPPVEVDSQGLVRVAAKDLPQTTIRMGHIGIDKADPDLHAVRVMNYLLGGGGFNSRLMREVRSNRGLAYSVYSTFRVGRRLPGPFFAGAETKSASTIEVARTMQEIIAGMQQERVSEEELSLARESLVNSFVFAFEDSHDVVTRIMRLDFFDYPEDYLERYRDRIAAVTAGDVQRVAREHLHPERLKMVLVGAPEAFEANLEDLGLPVEQVDLEAKGKAAE